MLIGNKPISFYSEMADFITENYLCLCFGRECLLFWWFAVRLGSKWCRVSLRWKISAPFTKIMHFLRIFTHFLMRHTMWKITIFFIVMLTSRWMIKHWHSSWRTWTIPSWWRRIDRIPGRWWNIIINFWS